MSPESRFAPAIPMWCTSCSGSRRAGHEALSIGYSCRLRAPRPSRGRACRGLTPEVAQTFSFNARAARPSAVMSTLPRGSRVGRQWAARRMLSAIFSDVRAWTNSSSRDTFGLPEGRPGGIDFRAGAR